MTWNNKNTNLFQHVSIGISFSFLGPTCDSAVFSTRQGEPRHLSAPIIVPTDHNKSIIIMSHSVHYSLRENQQFCNLWIGNLSHFVFEALPII